MDLAIAVAIKILSTSPCLPCYPPCSCCCRVAPALTPVVDAALPLPWPLLLSLPPPLLPCCPRPHRCQCHNTLLLSPRCPSSTLGVILATVALPPLSLMPLLIFLVDWYLPTAADSVATLCSLLLLLMLIGTSATTKMVRRGVMEAAVVIASTVVVPSPSRQYKQLCRRCQEHISKGPAL